MVKRVLGKVKEYLSGGGLFGKIWEPFGISMNILQEVLVIFFYMFGWFWVRVTENGKINTLGIINEWLRELWGYKIIWKTMDVRSNLLLQ